MGDTGPSAVKTGRRGASGLAVGCFLRLFVIFVLLYCPWPGLDRAYLACFRAAGNVLFGSIGEVGVVEFVAEFPRQYERFAPPAPPENWPVRLILKNRKTAKEKLQVYSARHGYLAAALTASLILATPIPWRRRCKVLIFGLILANGFAALRIYLGLLNEFSGDNPIAQFHPGPIWRSALELSVRMLTVSPEFTFVIPVFIWIAVTIRRRDLNDWRRTLSGGAGKSRPETHPRRNA